MKQGTHPEYRNVVIRDTSTDFSFMTRSTIQTGKTTVWEEDGKEYPLIEVEVSSQSHPFYTGKEKLLDSEGRVERFRKKYGSGKK
jgi:large subunit ribosomal protein L31